MSPSVDIPDPWREAMEKVGMHSLTQLAQKTGTGVSTLSDLVHGRRRASENTIEVVAAVLRRPVTTIREWASAALGEVGPYQPPAIANRLSKRQRRALDELIRSMIVESTPGSGKTESAAAGAQEDYGLAARRGPSEGRRLREEQDRDAEA